MSGSIVFTKQSKQRILDESKRIFSDEWGWIINGLNISLTTKEGLLAAAESERRSARGHEYNAKFYIALAEPLRSGQRTFEHWTKEQAVALKNQILKEAA